MSTVTDFPARGKITETRDGQVVFAPSNTNYQLHLVTAKGVAPAVGKLSELLLRVTARKTYTVPSGGNFVSPIFGPPKVIQGRVRLIEGNTIVVHAGVPFVVTLPISDTAVDLNNGPITLNSLINVVALPGVTFEWLQPAAAR